MASQSVCIAVYVCISGCKFLKWKSVTDVLGKSRLHLYLEILYLNLTVLPVMHDEAVSCF